MKNALTAITLFAVSLPCFSEDCFDSPEYKNSVAIAKAANSERAAQLGKAVDFLGKAKGLNFDQALGEVMRFSSPETIAYDKALSEVGEKIRPMKPQSSEECAELIKLQRQYEAIGKEKVQFVVTKVMEQQGEGSNPAVNTDAAR
jgi:hypothetical protein